MGKQVRFSVEARSAASPAAIYALLVDGATWPSWTPFNAFELERHAGHPPHGTCTGWFTPSRQKVKPARN